MVHHNYRSTRIESLDYTSFWPHTSHLITVAIGFNNGFLK